MALDASIPKPSATDQVTVFNEWTLWDSSYRIRISDSKSKTKGREYENPRKYFVKQGLAIRVIMLTLLIQSDGAESKAMRDR